MVDPPAPQDIARRSFDVVRRGYEQQEVRGFLHEVSALVDRLQRAETELRERAERAESKLDLAGHPDESTLLEVLGAETTRVLTSAHEAAAELRAKAEASVERIVADATTEAARLRSSAEADSEALLAAAKEQSEALLNEARGELERRTAEAVEAVAHLREEGEAQATALRAEGEALLTSAHAQAEAHLEEAREQGRQLVAEAQAVREKVLRDLVVRRKRARQQVEKLNAGRERLLQAYDVVRRTIDEATSELHVSLTDARHAANAAARRVDDEPDTSLEEMDAEVSAAGLLNLPVLELDDLDGDDDADDDEDDSPSPLSGEVPVVEATPTPPPAVVAPSVSPVPAGAESESAVEAAVSSVVGDAERPELPEGAATLGPVAALDDRRARKSRRRKGFDGLPPGELNVVAPPNPGESVRIIPAPSEPEPEQPDAPEHAAGPEVPAAAQDDEPTALEAPEVAAPDDLPSEPSPGPVDDLPAAVVVPENAEVTPEPPVTEPEVPGPEPEPEPDPEPEVAAEVATAAPDEASSSAEDVFARLRADSVPEVDAAEPASTEETDAPTPAVVEVESAAQEDLSAFAVRTQAVGPLEKELGRALKRALADEQNEVLDLLRRSKPKSVDDVLPDPAQHAFRWAEAAAEPLAAAAASGAAAGGGSATSVADLSTELAASLTAPLRERIDRGFAASDGNLDDIADRVRALYREWRGQRLSDAAQHYTAAAYAQGVLDAIDDGSKVCWVIDPSAGACPDCDDNVLAGAVVKGEEFPTGNTGAPAHPGCHCLVLPSPG